MRKLLSIFLALAVSPALAADFVVNLGDGWDGITVPDGQQCTLFDGHGATPPLHVTDLPAGTVTIHVEYNDLSYAPLSQNGGHGTIGYDVSGGSATLLSAPGLTDDLPDGIFVVQPARSAGRYASAGYLPPCSGGRGNEYSADVIALDATGNRIGMVIVAIGRY